MDVETIDRIIANLLSLAERATTNMDNLAFGLTSRAEVRQAYEELQKGPPEERYAKVQALVTSHGLDAVTKFLEEERRLYIQREFSSRKEHNEGF